MKQTDTHIRFGLTLSLNSHHFQMHSDETHALKSQDRTRPRHVPLHQAHQRRCALPRMKSADSNISNATGHNLQSICMCSPWTRIVAKIRACARCKNSVRVVSCIYHANNTPRKCLEWKTPAEVFKEKMLEEKG